ncbi:hypothetical protein ALC62_04334, partial [Cyphomyrmex costatus]
WLAPHSDLNKAFCSICNSSFRCCRADIIKHSQIAKHIHEIKNKNENLDNVVSNVSHDDKVKRAEIKTFYTLEHLISLLKDICSDHKIVQDLSLGRSAKKIFLTFKEFFSLNGILLTNFVGMASDNASVMIERNNSFFSNLKSEVPGLIMLNCICHSFALIASKSCEKLPHSCENLIRGLLILHKCVVRLLSNWEVSKSYFILVVVEDRSKSAEDILTLLNNNSIKAYLLFLKYSLNYFNTFNALFQSRKILIHKLYTCSNQIINEIAQNFIIPKALNEIATLNVDDNENIKHLTNVYVGPECENFLTAESLEFVQQIKLKCLDFYKTALKEKKKRTNFLRNFPTLELLEAVLCLPYSNKQLATKSDEQGEKFHQQIMQMECRYKGKSLLSMISDFCWSIAE